MNAIFRWTRRWSALPATSPISSSPFPPNICPKMLKLSSQSPCFNILMSFFLYLLILIRAGIVSCVYVRVVIIVVINDSSILTTGLNTTLEYLQSAPHNKTRNTRGGLPTQHLLLGRCQHWVSTLGVNTYLKEGAGWVTLKTWNYTFPY